ncbi:hypothetical protein DNI29_23100 [Hymenobacter sediminis]|uniref:hypothetical protein n=1 Tax=Hymenobacter sediminis TaxID=2218621 RepID=UPI000F4E6475|nr:hypothetical protein [Hymenobacter sediminis]RPD43750.1 hypothetical protein DNI29_23100 [Hymenobacter sediminis]
MFTSQQIASLEAGKAQDLPADLVLRELPLPYPLYSDFLYTECWLPGLATLPELLEGLRLSTMDIEGGMGPYYHSPLAERLPKTRALLAHRMPFIREFSDYLLQRERRQMYTAVGWLTYLTEQIHLAQAEDLDFFLTEIAATLQQRLVIRTETCAYQITELEFYYHSRLHPDPYVHRGTEQLQPLQWYFNQATSLDLTFGNRETNSYGGILLRGLQRISSAVEEPVHATHPYHIGPQVLTRALIASWGSAMSQHTSRLYIEETPAPGMATSATWRTERVGLVYRPEQEDEAQPYLHRPYRFIVDEGYVSKLPHKESICKHQYQQMPQKMDEATVRRVLGYKPGWL